MEPITIPCDRRNYGGLRAGAVEYVVIHYTAGDGDTAVDNGLYFSRNDTGKTSAHYFVDQTQIVASVPENAVAWHCGGPVYRHPRCRNSNAIGIELCSVRADGAYRIPPATLENGARLAAELMDRYELPPDRLLRHYDVTGKSCPAPMVGQYAHRWEEFRRKEAAMEQELFARRMEAYLQAQAAKAPSEWSRESRSWAERLGLIRGDGSALRYKSPVTREELMEILYRYENKEE